MRQESNTLILHMRQVHDLCAGILAAGPLTHLDGMAKSYSMQNAVCIKYDYLAPERFGRVCLPTKSM